MNAKNKIDLRYWPIALISSLLFLGFVRGELVDYRLATGAGETIGVLTEKRQHGVFQYRFEVNGESFVGSDQLDRQNQGSASNKVDIGSHVLVRYAKAWPAVSSLQQPAPYHCYRIFFAIAIAIAWVWLLKTTLTGRKVSSPDIP